MPMVLIESVDEFALRHGVTPESPQLQMRGDDGTRLDQWLFPDGAMMVGPTGLRGDGYQRHEPPDDPVEQTKLEVKYLELLRDGINQSYRECQDFIERQAMYHRGGVGPLPPDQAYADLRNYQTLHLEVEKRLKRKREELAALTPEPSPWDQRQAERAGDRRAADEAIAKMRAITGNNGAAQDRALRESSERIADLQQKEKELVGRALARTLGLKTEKKK